MMVAVAIAVLVVVLAAAIGVTVVSWNYREAVEAESKARIVEAQTSNPVARTISALASPLTVPLGSLSGVLGIALIAGIVYFVSRK